MPDSGSPSKALARRRKKPQRPPPLRRLRMGAQNAMELLRLGRLSPREGAPYEVVHRARHYKLRHYEGAEGGSGPLLLVPPLMLTAEIYDVAPDISAVRALVQAGVDTWVLDFGAPEREEGGMDRTLDDHVRSVADAIGCVARATSHSVHLAGYSQGGMFVYQAAAYCRSEDIASIVTFGSPVDIHRNLPKVSTDVTARLIRASRPFVEVWLKRLEGLPGVLTSTGFKMLSFRREIEQVAEFLSQLHDRRALQKRESRRRFLGGEGFVAWPGPALMKFIDEFIVHNRMMSGGFVIDGRTITLADVRVPILYFVGSRDEIARPPSVRAIRNAVLTPEVYEASLPAGHFGLVVGTVAMRQAWPAVVEWIRWQAGEGPLPEIAAAPDGEAATAPGQESLEIEDAAFEEGFEFELFYDTLVRTADFAAKWLNDVVEDAGDTVDQARYQLPRLLKLRRLDDDTVINMAQVLSEQAKKIGERTYFLYEGRAVTYADANRRIDYVVRGLIECGVRPGNLVGVLMNPRPSYLSIVVALNRLGAVSVLIKPTDDETALGRAVGAGKLQILATDPENAPLARKTFGGQILVLGGGPPTEERRLPEGVIDMEAIDPEAVSLPHWYRENPGRAEDLAMVIVTLAPDGVRAARITNRRWAFSAFGAAAACTLTPGDTVYCCLPLYHPAGLLVSAGGASVGGARLALATRFEPRVFWEEVHRYGATVVFYAGEMCRQLVDAPPRRGERTHSLRLFAGSGMRVDVWQRLVDRFGVGVLEFYAATEVSLVLANAAGEKIGSIGRALPGSREAFLAAYDMQREQLHRDRRGRLVPAKPHQPGVLLARIDPTPLSPLDDKAAGDHSGLPRVVRGVREENDPWFVTGDLVRVDDDGDYWFIDRLKNLVTTEHGPVPSRPIEDALYENAWIALSAVYGVTSNSNVESIVAAAVVREGHEPDLTSAIRSVQNAGLPVPEYFRLVDHIEMTDGFRPVKTALRYDGIESDGRTYRFDGTGYRLLTDHRAARA